MAGPILLTGGNPQIAKAHGDAPVQAYIAAMPGWKSEVGHRLDAIIGDAVPDVHKAVKWNNPLYGVEDGYWFISFRCYTKYVQLAFFRGTALQPMPSGASKQQHVRYFNIHEGDTIDQDLLADWVKQASLLPGERL